MTLGELIEKLGGKLSAGDPAQVVLGVNSVELSQATDLVFERIRAEIGRAHV